MTDKSDVIIYSKACCPYCDHAKRLLDSKGIAYIELRIDQDPQALAAMQAQTNNARTVPQIIIKEQAIGGFDDLRALNDAGKLDDFFKH